MNQILVEIILAKSNQSFPLYLEVNQNATEVVMKIAEEIGEEISVNKEYYLFSLDPMAFITGEKTLKMIGVHRGSRLVLREEACR